MEQGLMMVQIVKILKLVLRIVFPHQLHHQAQILSRRYKFTCLSRDPDLEHKSLVLELSTGLVTVGQLAKVHGAILGDKVVVAQGDDVVLLVLLASLLSLLLALLIDVDGDERNRLPLFVLRVGNIYV